MVDSGRAHLAVLHITDFVFALSALISCFLIFQRYSLIRRRFFFIYNSLLQRPSRLTYGQHVCQKLSSHGRNMLADFQPPACRRLFAKARRSRRLSCLFQRSSSSRALMSTASCRRIYEFPRRHRLPPLHAAVAVTEVGFCRHSRDVAGGGRSFTLTAPVLFAQWQTSSFRSGYGASQTSCQRRALRSRIHISMGFSP